MIYICADNIVESLEWLSDYKFQKVVWFENDQGLCYPYDDNVYDIFEGSALSETIQAGETVFGKEADKALMELELACDALGYNWHGKEKTLLESKDMKNIRDMAKRCLKLIDESNGSEITVKYLVPGEPPPDV